MIRFHPTDLLRKVAPKKKVERLVTRDLTLNRATVSMLADNGFMSKKKTEEIALKVIKSYKERYAEELKAGASETEAFEEAVNGRKQMVNRVQNAMVHEIAKDVKAAYHGEYYVWLPSDAEEPDPIHQLYYGKKFQLGKGEMPGDRYGCRCGMQILVAETKLDL